VLITFSQSSLYNYAKLQTDLGEAANLIFSPAIIYLNETWTIG